LRDSRRHQHKFRSVILTSYSHLILRFILIFYSHVRVQEHGLTVAENAVSGRPRSSPAQGDAAGPRRPGGNGCGRSSVTANSQCESARAAGLSQCQAEPGPCFFLGHWPGDSPTKGSLHGSSRLIQAQGAVPGAPGPAACKSHLQCEYRILTNYVRIQSMI